MLTEKANNGPGWSQSPDSHPALLRLREAPPQELMEGLHMMLMEFAFNDEKQWSEEVLQNVKWTYCTFRDVLLLIANEQTPRQPLL